MTRWGDYDYECEYCGRRYVEPEDARACFVADLDAANDAMERDDEQ